MTAGDWFHTAVNLVIGLFLGLALYGLAQLVISGFWPVAVIIVVIFAGYFLIHGIFDWLFEKILPSGIKPGLAERRRKKPMTRILGLPTGLALGVIAAWFGLTDTILEAMP